MELFACFFFFCFLIYTDIYLDSIEHYFFTILFFFYLLDLFVNYNCMFYNLINV